MSNNLFNQQAALQNLFGATHVPGLGFVQSSQGPTHLGDDASVMMISGLGSESRNVQTDAATGAVTRVTGAGWTLQAALTQPVKLFGIELPLWVWLLIASGVIGVAGYFMFLKKK